MAPSAVSPNGAASEAPWADCDDLRTQFTLAMAAMYKKEVPLYGDLVRIVGNVNSRVLNDPDQALDQCMLNMRYGGAESGPERIDIERHGSIRLGSKEELYTMRRVFAVIGLQPGGY